MKTVVISQPTYLPWSGYFRLMKEADTYVFLDTVQFERQSWQCRNRIKTQTGCKWLTIPIKHESLFKPINTVKVDNSKSWRKQHWEAIRSSYGKAPYFSAYAPFFESVYEKGWDNLSELNIHIIKNLGSQLSLAPRFLRSSDLNISGNRTERLISICKELEAGRYVTSIGALEYLEQDGGKKLFEQEKIGLTILEYEQPVYPQLFGKYVSGLSFIDMLFNCGPDSAEIVFADGNTRFGRIPEG